MLVHFTFVSAQAQAVFNFDSAVKASDLPETSVANSTPASMEKQYYIDPNTRLFDAPELKTAYQELSGLRSYYATNHSAVGLWEQTRNLLFSDKSMHIGKCESLSEGVLKGLKADSKADYKRKIQDELGVDLYADFQFCLDYLGMNYSDWELWQAYIADRTALVAEIKSLPRLTNRLKAFILAVDVRYTTCLANGDINGFVPTKINSESK
jgi:hypothetical protein